MYRATGGDDWWDSNKWLSNAPVGEWFGVTTDQNGFITGISLYENQLVGSVPAELENLAGLTKLSLFGNRLTGCVPKGLHGQLREASLGNLVYCP